MRLIESVYTIPHWCQPRLVLEAVHPNPLFSTIRTNRHTFIYEVLHNLSIYYDIIALPLMINHHDENEMHPQKYLYTQQKQEIFIKKNIDQHK